MKNKAKGRVMWHYHSSSDLTDSVLRLKKAPHCTSPAHAVLVLPLSDIEALVERRAKAACEDFFGKGMWAKFSENARKGYRLLARATLIADGVPAKLLKGKSK